VDVQTRHLQEAECRAVNIIAVLQIITYANYIEHQGFACTTDKRAEKQF